jgi:hypothetical protein
MHVLETSSLQQQGEKLTPAGVHAQQKKKKKIILFKYL